MFGVAFVIIEGCSHGRSNVSTTKESKILIAADVAIMAANLANDECERLYGKRPFYANLYSVEFRDNTWHWGRLDPAGINGLSAEVSFKQDGSNPMIKVYFSTDSNDRINILPEENQDIWNNFGLDYDPTRR